MMNKMQWLVVAWAVFLVGFSSCAPLTKVKAGGSFQTKDFPKGWSYFAGETELVLMCRKSAETDFWLLQKAVLKRHEETAVIDIEEYVSGEERLFFVGIPTKEDIRFREHGPFVVVRGGDGAGVFIMRVEFTTRPNLIVNDVAITGPDF